MGLQLVIEQCTRFWCGGRFRVVVMWFAALREVCRSFFPLCTAELLRLGHGCHTHTHTQTGTRTDAWEEAHPHFCSLLYRPCPCGSNYCVQHIRVCYPHHTLTLSLTCKMRIYHPGAQTVLHIFTLAFFSQPIFLSVCSFPFPHAWLLVCPAPPAFPSFSGKWQGRVG